MAGLIGIGRQTLGQATGGFGAASQLEQSRNAMGRQIDAARNAQRMSMVTTGGGLGASIGVNNLLKQQAAQKAAEQAALKAGTQAVTSAAPNAPALAALETVPTVTPDLLLQAARADGAAILGKAAGTGTAATGTTAAGTASALLPSGGVLPTGVVASSGTTTLTAGATPVVAGSKPILGTLGAVATPLLIGAAGALLLDSLFDIF